MFYYKIILQIRNLSLHLFLAIIKSHGISEKKFKVKLSDKLMAANYTIVTPNLNYFFSFFAQARDHHVNVSDHHATIM